MLLVLVRAPLVRVMLAAGRLLGAVALATAPVPVIPARPMVPTKATALVRATMLAAEVKA